MKISALFRKIELLQGETPWGDFLDAGTGDRSLPWVASLPTRSWTAVTMQKSMADAASRAVRSPARACDRLIIGNWADKQLLAGERFDTVLLDYVIGALDAFAPYHQEAFLQHMASRVRGALYVTGLEPYVPVVADEEVGQFVGDLGRLRDACMLLARDRPYREYPAQWVAQRLRHAGLDVTHLGHFRIRNRQAFLASQLGICEERAGRFRDPALASAMLEHIAMMRRRGEALMEEHDGLPYGRDYVLRAVVP